MSLLCLYYVDTMGLNGFEEDIFYSLPILNAHSTERSRMNRVDLILSDQLNLGD